MMQSLAHEISKHWSKIITLKQRYTDLANYTLQDFTLLSIVYFTTGPISHLTLPTFRPSCMASMATLASSSGSFMASLRARAPLAWPMLPRHTLATSSRLLLTHIFAMFSHTDSLSKKEILITTSLLHYINVPYNPSFWQQKTLGFQPYFQAVCIFSEFMILFIRYHFEKVVDNMQVEKPYKKCPSTHSYKKKKPSIMPYIQIIPMIYIYPYIHTLCIHYQKRNHLMRYHFSNFLDNVHNNHDFIWYK